MSYTVHQAKTNLSKLIKEAEEGKEVIITRGKQPVARLVAIENAAIENATEDRTPGGGTSQSTAAPAAFDPLTDEELKELDL
ncbi:MAG TPA: type II toxin-antitoxin system prevent-host-death family antitoxin [Terriglobales bacterium]|jgi:prevent-host-death family protein